MADAQVRITDVIRSELIAFIYSDTDLEDAQHLEEIFKNLNAIDAKFSDIDQELKEKRRKIIELQMELRKAACEKKYEPTEGIDLFNN